MANSDSGLCTIINGIRVYDSPVYALANREKPSDDSIANLHGYAPHLKRTFGFIHDVTLPNDQSKLEAQAGMFYDQALKETIGSTHRIGSGKDVFAIVSRKDEVVRNAQYIGILADKSSVLPSTSGYLRDGSYSSIMITLHIPYTMVPCKPKA